MDTTVLPQIVGRIKAAQLDMRQDGDCVLFVPLDPLEAVEIERSNGQIWQIKYGISYTGHPAFDTMKIQTLAPNRETLSERLVNLNRNGHWAFDLGDGFVMQAYGGRSKLPPPADAPEKAGWMIRQMIPITEPKIQWQKPQPRNHVQFEPQGPGVRLSI